MGRAPRRASTPPACVVIDDDDEDQCAKCFESMPIMDGHYDDNEAFVCGLCSSNSQPSTRGEKRALAPSTGVSEASEDESSDSDFDAAPVSTKARRARAARSVRAPDATAPASAGQRPGAAATSDDAVAGRRGKHFSSRFYGVCWHWQENPWAAIYRDEHGNDVHIAYFYDEEAAARAYNAKIAKLGLSHCRATNADIGGVLQSKPEMSSQYMNVSWNNYHRHWTVFVTASKVGLKRRKGLGNYDEEQLAAHAQDRFWREAVPSMFADKANFPAINPPTDADIRAFEHMSAADQAAKAERVAKSLKDSAKRDRSGESTPTDVPDLHRDLTLVLTSQNKHYRSLRVCFQSSVVDVIFRLLAFRR
ncbi:hypothetical protein SO694_00083060 [Aureococcus anophagefferens]|uniref:AP2/ERF domain-containing protein n=1 Tax=Aureococcus anophagefferens TaxID=44056 RepID=A0ABR1FJB2_AURAN